MIRKLLFISLAILYLINNEASNGGAEENTSEKTIKNIQGNWSSIWANADSCKIDKEVYFQFVGDKVHLTYKKDVKPIESKFKIIPSAEPGKGSINIIDPSTHEFSKGLYILKGDTLMLYIPSIGEPRPKEISAYLKKDENILFWVLVREKLKE